MATHIFLFEWMHVLLVNAWPLCLHDRASALLSRHFSSSTSMLNFYGIISLWCFCLSTMHIMCKILHNLYQIWRLYFQMTCFHLQLYFYHRKISTTVNLKIKTTNLEELVNPLRVNRNLINIIVWHNKKFRGKNFMTNNITSTPETFFHEKEFD